MLLALKTFIYFLLKLMLETTVKVNILETCVRLGWTENSLDTFKVKVTERYERK